MPTDKAPTFEMEVLGPEPDSAGTGTGTVASVKNAKALVTASKQDMHDLDDKVAIEKEIRIMQLSCDDDADATMGSECHDHGPSADREPPCFISGPRKLIWDIMMLFLIIYSTLVIPWALGFDVDLYAWTDVSLSRKFLFCMSIFVDFCFVLDMVFTFFSPATEPATGLPIFDRGYIASTYLRGWFILDIVSTVPFDVIFEALLHSESEWASATKLIRATRLVKLLKLLRIMRLSRTLANVVSFGSPWYPTVQALKILVYYMMLSHWISCFWFLVLRLEHETRAKADPYYMQTDKVLQCGDRGNLIYNMSLSEKYSCSMYWTLQTLTTVGYGDMIPSSNNERIYNIFAFGCGTAVFAIVSACVVHFVMNKDQGVNEYRDKVVGTMKYMRRRKIDGKLIHAVQEFYQHRWESKQSLDESTYFADLPISLRYQIFIELNSKLLANVSIFETSMRELTFAERVVELLVAKCYMSGDVIFEKGDAAREMFFIARGKVKLTSATKTSTLEEGGYFGEGNLLLGHTRKSDAETLTYVELFTLHQEEFNELTREFNCFREAIKEETARLKEKNLCSTDADNPISPKENPIAKLRRGVAKLRHESKPIGLGVPVGGAFEASNNPGSPSTSRGSDALHRWSTRGVEVGIASPRGRLGRGGESDGDTADLLHSSLRAEVADLRQKVGGMDAKLDMLLQALGVGGAGEGEGAASLSAARETVAANRSNTMPAVYDE